MSKQQVAGFEGSTRHDPLAAMRVGDFRLFSIGGLMAIIGQQMQSVAVGWELYERTNAPLALGWVGLSQVIPIFLLSLPAGHIADRFNRKHIILLTQSFAFLCSLSLALLSYWRGPIELFYLILFFNGVSRAFMGPARSAMIPQLVPRNLLANAANWNSSIFQIGAVVGPALGGLGIALARSATPVYLADAIMGLLRFLFIALIKYQPGERAAGSATLKTLVAGLSFVWNAKIIFASITLDMFAVLLGGATALLPIFAKDILHVGPTGLGWLQAAPSIGSVLMAFIMAYLPPLRQAGKTLLWAVAGFGVATIVFGLSHWYWLSLAMLFLAGAFDHISVVIRHTLVQVLTPDDMRGRVAAVNNIFIASSNELGRFESGFTAKFFGPILSVVGGGIGTVLVVITAMLLWPQLTRFGSLEEAAENMEKT